MRDAVVVLSLVALVMVSGCVGSLSDGGPPDAGGADSTTDGTGGESTTTVTELRLSDVALPDGVSEEGVNVSEVMAGHEAALADRSFTSRLTFSQRTPGGEESLEMTAQVAAGGIPRSATVNGSDQQVALYLTEETEYQRYVVAGETRYEVRNRTPEAISFVPVSPSGASFIERFAGVVNFTATDAHIEDGTPVVVLSGQGVVPTYRENVTEFDATMLVDERGVVREVTMTVQFATDPGGTITFEYAVSNVGETTVDEPAWLAEAEREDSA